MKYYVAAFIALLTAVQALGQTNLRTVMVNSNGVVEKPTNFNSVNGFVVADTNTGSVQYPTNFWTNVVPSIFWSNNSANIASILNLSDAPSQKAVLGTGLASMTTNGGTVTVTNSYARLTTPNTNASAFAALRLMAEAGSRNPNGAGTTWATFNNEFYVTAQYAMNTESNKFRVVVGNFQYSSTNIATIPTSPAVGYEVMVDTNDDLLVRLIAHNGTNLINGPFVSLAPNGDIYQRYTIGVRVNKTNGACSLLIGTNSMPVTVIPSAQITGPTINASGNYDSFDIGIFNAETGGIGGTVQITGAEFVQKQ